MWPEIIQKHTYNYKLKHWTFTEPQMYLIIFNRTVTVQKATVISITDTHTYKNALLLFKQPRHPCLLKVRWLYMAVTYNK